MTLAPVDQSDLDKRDAEKLGKHEISVRDFGAGASGASGGPIVGGFWEETQTTKRDKASQALCAQCGKPGEDLAKCGGCRLVRYEILSWCGYPQLISVCLFVIQVLLQRASNGTWVERPRHCLDLTKVFASGSLAQTQARVCKAAQEACIYERGVRPFRVVRNAFRRVVLCRNI